MAAGSGHAAAAVVVVFAALRLRLIAPSVAWDRSRLENVPEVRQGALGLEQVVCFILGAVQKPDRVICNGIF
jgi:hypothetical protein